jgi:iron complex outermembrane recepter protein
MTIRETPNPRCEDGPLAARAHCRARRSLLTKFAAGAALGLAIPVYAQQAATTAADRSDSTATTGVDEVIVTASKRSESIIKAPMAVSALSQTQLEDAGVVQLKDLTTVAPGVEIGVVSVANSIQVSIRGISNTDFNATGNPAVATYIDGVYIARTQGLAGNLYDLERIEVLRGPQGTLYGRNATGGNLNVITADPQNVLAGSVETSYGSYNDVQTRGMLNIPVTDTLAIRGSFATHRSDGYFRTDGTTDRNYAAADDFSGRITALWKPIDNFKWRLGVDDFVSQGTPGLSLDTAPDGSPIGGSDVYDHPLPGVTQPAALTDNLMVRSRMDLQLDSHNSVSYVSGFQKLISRNQFEGAAVFDGIRTVHAKSQSHEINLISDYGGLQNTFGGSYLNSTNTNYDRYHLYTAGSTLADLEAPLFTQHAWGIFDQATYSILQDWRVIGGVRYSSETQSYTQQTNLLCPVTITFAQMATGYDGPGCVPSISPYNAGKWTGTSYKAGTEYDLNDRTTAYFTVTSGFKSGGLNLAVPTNPTFLPETVTNYELGFKSQFLDNRASVTSALFFENYKNIQVTQITPAGTAQITTNAAKAAIYGLELEGQWRVTPQDHLSGFLDLQHATYRDYANAVDQLAGTVYPSLSGNYLPNAPKVSAKFQFAHDFLLPGNGNGTLTPSVSVYGQTVSYLREFNFPIDRVAGYSKTDIILTYKDVTERWTAAAYVNNLEDSAVRSSGWTTLGHYFTGYNAPRMAGVRLAYSFQ